MFLYALTIFTGAFLVFQIQPLIARYILPWFGGGPGVWTTCLLFFQLALLAGYGYAHLSSGRLKPRVQAIVHMVLLVVAAALLPITPSNAWKPLTANDPVWHILALLAANIGLPYFVLSSTAPLMQRWFTLTYPAASPYRLYALSNLGSLLALVSYPFYFETHFSRRTQAFIWGCGLVLYAVCATVCALKLLRAPGGRATQTSTDRSALDSASPKLAQRGLWLLLPACASVLLLATTNKLCRDMLVMPFLWVLPLAIYLLTFIISFDSPRWYARPPFALALVVAEGGICWTIFRGDHWPAWKLVSAYAGALFICCMVCHGEVYRLRPAAAHLTEFYLMIAGGGALGGVFVALAAPLIFSAYYELHAGLLLCVVLFLAVCARDWRTGDFRQWRWMACVLPLVILGGFDWLLRQVWISEVDLRDYLSAVRAATWGLVLLMAGAGWIYRDQLGRYGAWQAATCTWILLGVFALGISLWVTRERPLETQLILDTSRNFYGRVRVFESAPGNPERHMFGLLHERISHGWQLADPARASQPTLYYSERSGVGLAMRALPPANRRMGLIGLGVGTLAAYAQPGDYLRIYEINPEVVRLAESRFSYLSNCRGKVEVVPGDARLSLEKEAPQQFDLLVLDAFSGDNIPVHLLTKEAFEIYQRHVITNGIIAVHISNLYLDLEPAIANLARCFSYKMAIIDYNGSPEEWWIRPSRWILLTHNDAIINSPMIREAASSIPDGQKLLLWTDDFASLFQILHARRSLAPPTAAGVSQ
jgi:hypothetical protein